MASNAVLTMVVIAGGINTYHAAVTQGKDPFRVAISSFLVAGVLIVVDAIDNPFAEAMTVLYLVGSILKNGSEIIKVGNTVSTGKK